MAGLDNPFANLFNPDTAERGTLTGFLSRFNASPSATASGDAVAKIMADIQGGKNPQKAVVDFFATPEGSQAFVANPNIMDTIAKAISQITPPPLQAINTPPGGLTTTIDPNTRQQSQIRNPTTENQNYAVQGHVVNTPAGTQTTVLGPNGEVRAQMSNPATEVQVFNEMAKIAKLPPEQLQQFAQSNMLVGGRYKVAPVHNATGDVVGMSVLDTLTGRVTTPESAGIGPQRPPEEKPGVTSVGPDMRNPDGSVDMKKLVAGRAGMFLGSGFWPSVLSGVNSTMGSVIHPALGIDAGRTATMQKANLEDLKTAVYEFPQVVGRTNKLIDQLTKNLNFGWFSDPLDATRQGINLYDDIQGEIAAAENTIKDLNLPKDVRIQASKDIQGYNRILRKLPNRGEMVEMEKAILGNKIPGLGVTAAGQSAVDAARKVGGATGNVVSGKEPIAPGQTPEQPAAPAVTPNKQGVDFNTMGPQELLKVNPKTLSPEQRKQLQLRLNQLLTKPK